MNDLTLDSLTSYQQRLEQVLQQQLDKKPLTDPRLHQAMAYSLLLGGKRMRPFLVYSCGQMLGACINGFSMVRQRLLKPCIPTL